MLQNLISALLIGCILGSFYYLAEYPKQSVWSPHVACEDLMVAVKRIVSAENKGNGAYLVKVIEDTPKELERLMAFFYSPVSASDIVYFTLNKDSSVTMDVQPLGFKSTQTLKENCAVR